ncbi:MAG: hypothetical protein WCJ87_05190 [Burkholderiales bacterium]
MKQVANLNQALESMDIDSRLKEVIHDLLGHISGVARERRGRAVDVATGHETGPIADGHPLVMVIPGEGNGLGACLPILLAVSDSKHRGAKSPKAVMQRMQEVLVECDPIVQVAIFLSDATGIGAVLEDNIKLMDVHLRKGKLKGFLPVVAVGNQLTVLDWRP